jgi:glycosyltransferase involved in cell wall biosynthesis
MKRDSTIAIVIISFNVEKLLKECLESVYRETTQTNFGRCT